MTQDPKKIADDLPPESDAADEETDALDDAPLDLLADAPPDEGSEEGLQRGAEAIRRCLRDAPAGPGVYRMLSEAGEVLYVGKARSVRKRIASYVRPHGLSTRIARMVSATASMVFVSTRTETEALLLEANYIKQMKPRFNVLMRDDKSFPYIFLGGELNAPQLTKHRGARTRTGDYFGPFASVWAVDRTLAALQRAFLLRSCSDSYYENRTRPCLLWQIKRCSGPCTGEISLSDYASLVDEARDFLSGKSRAVRDRLALEMAEASDKLEFEKAARLRDRISALSAIQGQQGINPRSVEEADVFAIAEDAGQFCIEAFFFRAYQNWGNKAYFPRADRNFSAQEVLDAFLAQFYSDKPAPALVLLSHDIENRAVLEDALSERAGKRVAVQRPQRGEKKELVAQAAENALRTLSQKLAQAASQQHLLESLATVFALPGPLRRVEVYDNSHIMGSNAVGAMIVAGPTGFMKAHYRTFNFRDETIRPGDDYGMMREVLRRRLRRLVKPADGPEQPAADEFPARPDLILIDGGRGQFEVAKSVFQELGIEDIALASIAKGADRDAGRETFFLEGREPFRLPPRDPALYFVQRLRDEAHRFAIGAHRARRKKQIVRNPLDEIDGIGPARKRALLNAFGSAKAVAGAGLADLEKTPGINAATAKLVYDFFHDRTG